MTCGIRARGIGPAPRQVHGDGGVAAAGPERHPFGEGRSAATVHEHDAGPRPGCRCLTRRAADARRRGIQGEHPAGVAPERLARIEERPHGRRVVEPLDGRRHAEGGQIPGQRGGQVRAGRDPRRIRPFGEQGRGIDREQGDGCHTHQKRCRDHATLPSDCSIPEPAGTAAMRRARGTHVVHRGPARAPPRRPVSGAWIVPTPADSNARRLVTGTSNSCHASRRRLQSPRGDGRSRPAPRRITAPLPAASASWGSSAWRRGRSPWSPRSLPPAPPREPSPRNRPRSPDRRPGAAGERSTRRGCRP